MPLDGKNDLIAGPNVPLVVDDTLPHQTRDVVGAVCKSTPSDRARPIDRAMNRLDQVAIGGAVRGVGTHPRRVSVHHYRLALIRAAIVPELKSKYSRFAIVDAYGKRPIVTKNNGRRYCRMNPSSPGVTT